METHDVTAKAFEVNFAVGILTSFAIVVCVFIYKIWNYQNKREREMTDLLIKTIQENTQAFYSLKGSIDLMIQTFKK